MFRSAELQEKYGSHRVGTRIRNVETSDVVYKLTRITAVLGTSIYTADVDKVHWVLTQSLVRPELNIRCNFCNDLNGILVYVNAAEIQERLKSEWESQAQENDDWSSLSAWSGMTSYPTFRPTDLWSFWYGRVKNPGNRQSRLTCKIILYLLQISNSLFLIY